MAKHAQIAITDLVFGIVIFLFLLTTFLIVYTRLNNRLNDAILFNDLELSTIHTADLLTKHPGSPADWETHPNDLQVLGLARDDRVLSPAKIQALANLSSNTTLSILNVKRYNLYLLIRTSTQGLLELGQPPAKRTVHIQRIVQYENAPATLDVALSEQ